MLLGPWGQFPLKNQSLGIGPSSLGGDGDVLPTLEPKTPGPWLKGDRRYSLPRRPPAQPWGQDPSKNQSGLILTKLLREVGMGVGRCAVKMAG